MNWFKKSQPVLDLPIQIVSYNQTYNELGIKFKGNNTIYTYRGINPHIYDKIDRSLRSKNPGKYKIVGKMLIALSKYWKSLEQENNIQGEKENK